MFFTIKFFKYRPLVEEAAAEPIDLRSEWTFIHEKSFLFRQKGFRKRSVNFPKGQPPSRWLMTQAEEILSQLQLGLWQDRS